MPLNPQEQKRDLSLDARAGNEKLFFTVDSALLSELGEKLVESVHIALLELVKNSYDADATKATVEISSYSETEYKIVVKDNGVGMSLEDVKKYWMRIATNNKAENRVSDVYGRKKSGSKGIGRFSCRRLGPELYLDTTAQLKNGKYETTSFYVNWAAYKPGTDVSEIECDGETTRTSAGKTGTSLEIIGSKKGWDRGGWGVLKRRLMLLVINRGNRAINGKKDDPGFDISLIAPDFEESSITNPREDLMNAGWGRLTLKVKEDGEACWSLDAKTIGQKKIIQPERYPELAGTTADIAFLPDVKNQFRNPDLILKTSLQEALNNWGSIYVRAEGIRVYPYGERGDDWLEIDRDRGLRQSSSRYLSIKSLAKSLRGVTEGRELLNLLSAKSHVGEVIVSSPNNLFEMKASREGFVGDLAISTLRTVVRFGIDWATVYRDYFLRLMEQESLKRAQLDFATSVSSPEDLEEALKQEPVVAATKYLDKEIRNLTQTLPKKENKRVLESASKAIDLILESKKVREHELQHLRLVAATSSLFLVFQHEVRSLLGVLGEFDIRLKKLSRKMVDASAIEDIAAMRKTFDDTKSNFNSLLEMTSLLSVDAKRDSAKRLAISVRARKAVECFRLICKNYDLKIDLSGIPTALKVGPLLEAELLSIFMNTISNSIKSVIAAGTKNIAIVADQLSDNRIKLNILDSGLGVEPGNDDLFLPFLADPKGQLYSSLHEKLNPEDEHIVGAGSGLGLPIVRDIAVSHNGSASFVVPPEGWTCNLEIIIK
nr:ATP-binding protein [uncultured Desulfuromonas sp.]